MRFLAGLMLGRCPGELGVEGIAFGKSSFEIDNRRLKVCLNPIPLGPRGIAFGFQPRSCAARKQPTNDATQN